MSLPSTLVISSEANPAYGNVVLSFAVLGDAELKPEAAFSGVSAAVDEVNALALARSHDFVAGVGDIAHKGTTI